MHIKFCRCTNLLGTTYIFCLQFLFVCISVQFCFGYSRTYKDFLSCCLYHPTILSLSPAVSFIQQFVRLSHWLLRLFVCQSSSPLCVIERERKREFNFSSVNLLGFSSLYARLQEGREEWIPPTSVTRCRNKKLPNFPQSCPIGAHGRFYFKSALFQNSRKKFIIFGKLLQKELWPRSFKNSPIWSH